MINGITFIMIKVRSCCLCLLLGLKELTQEFAPTLIGHKEADDPEPEPGEAKINKINDVHEQLRARDETCGTTVPDGRPS